MQLGRLYPVTGQQRRIMFPCPRKFCTTGTGNCRKQSEAHLFSEILCWGIFSLSIPQQPFSLLHFIVHWTTGIDLVDVAPFSGFYFLRGTEECWSTFWWHFSVQTAVLNDCAVPYAVNVKVWTLLVHFCLHELWLSALCKRGNIAASWWLTYALTSDLVDWDRVTLWTLYIDRNDGRPRTGGCQFRREQRRAVQDRWWGDSVQAAGFR